MPQKPKISSIPQDESSPLESNELIVREAVADDSQVLAEIERECFAQPHWDEDSFLNYTCLVAEVQGRIAGFLVSRQILPGVRGAKPEREILNLAVTPVYRHMGIATALLKRELHSDAIHYLEVRESNVAAQKLYRKLGFIEIGRRRNYYDGPIETAIVMRMK